MESHEKNKRKHYLRKMSTLFVEDDVTTPILKNEYTDDVFLNFSSGANLYERLFLG